MFSSTGLFKQVECPAKSHCSLPNCIFSHDSTRQSVKAKSHSTGQDFQDEARSDQEPPRKRQKISKRDLNGSAQAAHGVLRAVSKLPTSSLTRTRPRSITPPPLRRSKVAEKPSIVPKRQNSAAEFKRDKVSTMVQEPVEVSLNPKMLPNAPAPHQIRMQLIEMLHRYMTHLNEGVKRSDDPSKSALELTAQELIKIALAEEIYIAKQNPSVYMNVIKNRIMRLKKMTPSEWREERMKQTAKEVGLHMADEAELAPKGIDTGLSPAQEISLLSTLIAKQNPLAEYGYVPSAPTEEEISKARIGVEASLNWEVCDRCNTRFQVFPDRRTEDGALTSGGKCTYHPSRARRPNPSDRALIHGCCTEAPGASVGCTTAATHVFKVSDPKRLSLIMPFEPTPPNPSPPKTPTAVAFDCEMGYTTLGMELIRLTAVSYPSGEPLIDVLVRPLGTVLDLNSRYSGIFPADYASATPYTPGNNLTPNADQKLYVVPSPQAARTLLFSYLTPTTPLLGHALDNDLNTTRIIHPTIVDTVLLYPHPKGLPLRFGLKMLMKQYLNTDIQTGGEKGHDSAEDARAASDLVRLKVKDAWRGMKRDGWMFRDGKLFHPTPGAKPAARSAAVKIVRPVPT